MRRGIFRTFAAKSRLAIFPGLILLIVLGLMNVVNNITYREPADGFQIEESGGFLYVKQVDFEDKPAIKVGDRLISIGGSPLNQLDAYENHVFDLTPGSTQTYVIERGGVTLEWDIRIRGVKQDKTRYYLFAFSGFIYLIFLFLVLNQNISFGAKRSLALLCFFVFTGFVFYEYTDDFSYLDLISFFISRPSGLLIASALTGVALNLSFPKSRWLPFLQAIHWIPTLVLTTLIIWFAVNAASQWLSSVEDIARLLGGGLTVLALVLLALVAELRSSEKNYSLFWAIAWAPFAFFLWRVNYPYDYYVYTLAPVVLPIALLYEWRDRDELQLGNIGRKIIINMAVLFSLVVGYFLFLGLFQLLLGEEVNDRGEDIILAIGILFAATGYTPLTTYAAEALDRFIYGKRLEAIRILSDFSGINRADTHIDDFLHIILNRIKNAFLIDQGVAYKAESGKGRFQRVEIGGAVKENFTFTQSPAALLQGEVVRGDKLQTYLRNPDDPPFNPNDQICPIREKGKLAALIVLTPSGSELKLSPEERRLMKSLLHQCDVLMENMELYHSIQRQVAETEQLKEFNENIIESSRIGILTCDEMGRSASCNSALAELAGLQREDILKKSFEDLFNARSVKIQRQIQAGFALEGAFSNAAGDDLLLEITKTPLKTSDNEVYGTLYLVEDILERKRMDEQLMQQEKLASIGLLAAGVAHEINTPLTGIASYSQLLIKDQRLDEDHRELLDLIQDQSQRAANIVRELLHFSRKEAALKGPVNLREVLDQTIRFLSHQIQKRKVRITIIEPEGDVVIDGYANQIQQVYLNLVVNAMDAMPDGGDLEIGFHRGRGAIVQWFKDQGLGMDEETRSRIFDPFFTTKEVGKGTGLGLSVVFKILQDHEVAIEVDSRPGKGTTFRLRFTPKGEKPISPWQAAARGEIKT